MKTNYTARAYRNPGRSSFVISFRHPLKTENGRPGRKVCKGLGTDEEGNARKLEEQMNSLLARPELHSLASRAEAARLYDAAIIEIFYEDLDPAATSHRTTRERLLKLPTGEEDGYIRTLLLGVAGAGKTTLLRRLIGSDAQHDRFPSTSVNRTTTCEIEVITGERDYSAVVTFLSRHQTQQEVIESTSNAVLKAIDKGSDAAVMTEFLEQSDQRFRLKYVLGGWVADSIGDVDTFTFDTPASDTSEPVSSGSSKFLKATLTRIREIAAAARQEVEPVLGALDVLKGDERDYALDEMQQIAEQSEAFLDLVSDIMDEIAERFMGITTGQFNKTSTGWPDAWTFKTPSDQREGFLDAVRDFCGNHKEQWGRLLTPLVTGIRVSGPFRPKWVPADEEYRHVFIDTEGLLHARTTTEVPGELTSLFPSVNTVLLVESAKNALHSPIAGKVFEAMASTGYTAKFAVLFTHMDMVSGDNLTTAASKRDYVFGGVRNVLENQVARNVSREAARQLGGHLQSNTFYFAYLDPNRYPTTESGSVEKFEARLGGELVRLTEQLVARSQPQKLQSALPKYSFESLGMAVRDASLAFQEAWDARLGYRRVENVTSSPWQSIKAMARRYAEGWFDGYRLSPIDTLTSLTRNVLTRFLETPMEWEGKSITDDEKAVVINRLKQVVNDALTELSKTRLWKVPQADWQGAYGLSGTGSTFTRKQRVRDIFTHQVPVPQSISDRWAQTWVEEIKSLLIKALEVVKTEQKPKR
jgi:hypothetical protein